LRIICLYQQLPHTGEAEVLGKQLLRSATSVAANYRASCRARSGAEYYAKLCVC
jgi:four helix bundle protein